MSELYPDLDTGHHLLFIRGASTYRKVEDQLHTTREIPTTASSESHGGPDVNLGRTTIEYITYELGPKLGLYPVVVLVNQIGLELDG